MPRHYCGKTVTAPGNSLDTTAVRPSLIEDAAKRCDLDGQIIVLDHGPRPDCSHDLVLRHKIAVGRDQHTKHLERARSDRHGDKYPAFISLAETAPVETKALEQKSPAAGKRLHACASPQLQARRAMTKGPPIA